MKEKILYILSEKQGEYVSGQELADRLSVSRAAIWKGIETLRKDGIPIEASTNRGYMLSPYADVLSPEAIRQKLGGLADRIRIRAYREVASTNTEAKEAARRGEPEGLVILSEMQTGGYGRRGRKFYSPASSGLYMSILLRPDMAAESSLLITTAAAVSAAEAIETVGDRKTGIKWVNDITVDGKKVCGILTEAALSLESGSLDYAVLGIGVNLREPEGGFPEELRDVAGAVFNRPVPDARNRLAAGILKSFFSYYDSLAEKRFFETYKSRLTVLGRRITVIKPEGTAKAEATDLDGDFRLTVRYDDGKTEALSSGEVSTKPE